MNTTKTTASLAVASKAEVIDARINIEKMGEYIAMSNLFGLAGKNDSLEQIKAKGVVVAGLCHQEGISYLEFMRKYHFVNGKVDMRADAMLAEFIRLGGKLQIERSDPGAAIATFEFNGCSYRESLIWEELKKNPEPPFFENIQNTDNWVVGKNYIFPRKRSQMLWARCVSNAIRKVCPLVNMGMYTPEEVQEFDNTGVIEATVATPAADPAPAKAEAEIVDADFESTAPSTTPPAFPSDQSDSEKYALCPCGNENTIGKRWDSFDTAFLQEIYDGASNPQYAAFYTGIMQGHLDYIAALIAMRNENGR